MKAVMIRTRFEEKLRLIEKSSGIILSCIIISIITPISFTLIIHVFNSIDIFRDIGFAFMKSNVIPLLWMFSWPMISLAIISSVFYYKRGLAFYDEAANKEYTEKDLDRCCNCGLMKDGKYIQHKLLTHKFDKKFFIQ